MIAVEHHPLLTLIFQAFICGAVIVCGLLVWFDTDFRKGLDDDDDWARRHPIDTTPARHRVDPPRFTRDDPSPTPRRRAS